MNTEDRITALEKQVQRNTPLIKGSAKKLRDHRAVLILITFMLTLAGLTIEKVAWSKEGKLDVSFREVGLEAIVAGLVAASLVADGDAKAILDRFLRK
mgnify:CR=1 FL=1|jgi:hypothetical protein